jgi:hypothetical protein
MCRGLSYGKKNSHQLLRRASHRHSICGFWPKTGRNSQTSIHQHIYYVAFFVVADFGLKPAETLKLKCPSTFCGINPRQSRLFENRCLFLQRKSRFLLRLRMALRAQPLARGLFRNGGDQTFHVIPIHTYIHTYIGIYIYIVHNIYICIFESVCK